MQDRCTPYLKSQNRTLIGLKVASGFYDDFEYECQNRTLIGLKGGLVFPFKLLRGELEQNLNRIESLKTLITAYGNDTVRIEP